MSGQSIEILVTGQRPRDSPLRDLWTARLIIRESDFQFIPFGVGRRMCPGMSFGMANAKLTLANLLFHFDWTLPAEQNSIDMAECFGAGLRIQYTLDRNLIFG
ncbi:unnamed protein product [Linum tenue]|uniref:Cytochrome P450 n=1 Tax=Linum tenue TaxID=586396 RepID=A0AAV0LJZ6_9ROSI|nr:unnamed protein product [Linum tenue]